VRNTPRSENEIFLGWKELPYGVSVNLSDIKSGLKHFVTTQRSDRTDVPREELPQGAFVSHECDADAQAMIHITEKRCHERKSRNEKGLDARQKRWEMWKPSWRQCMVRNAFTREFGPR
jgi:hypothetical protein